MINLVEELKANDINIDYIDIGGGLGVFYKDEKPPSIGDYVDTISSVLKERNVNLDIHLVPAWSSYCWQCWRIVNGSGLFKAAR